jgi:hypothetical protein
LAPAIPVFGACSVFTHVTACKLAESPQATLSYQGFDRFVTSSAAGLLSGWNDRVAGWVSHPRDDPNLITAHVLLGEQIVFREIAPTLWLTLIRSRGSHNIKCGDRLVASLHPAKRTTGAGMRDETPRKPRAHARWNVASLVFLIAGFVRVGRVYGRNSHCLLP